MQFQKQKYSNYKLGVTTLFIISGTITNQSAFAQLVPDNTLKQENSIVNSIDSIKDRIEGGATRGTNLFHSFQEFNVDAGKSVYFANPVNIENILTRVTGGNVSNILGKLGVEGTANLFLINPNGIYFGKDASLDISGSFIVTAADGIQLGTTGVFSAKDPQSSNLLSVQPGALFINALINQQTEIKNEGNLTVGQNLTFNADNINLSGKLQAGNNLTLQANNILKIQDTITQPLIASAGGNLLIQGNQLLDIFALNNPHSGLFSGGDMVLRSANTVGGDAHYWSGGNFRIEQLDGNLGNLDSPDDPIIRSSGDVSFASYTGASLHIFAGGSVNVTGNITITGTDTTQNSIQEIVTLSDGTQININGSTQPTLDIRAGTTAFGNPGIIGNTSGFSSIPSTNGTVTSADINIGSITNNGGTVFLTNQYFLNPSLTGEIVVSGINTSSNSGGGNVTLDSRNGITVNGQISANTNGEGDAGNVNIMAADSIDVKANARILARNNGGKGNAGSIKIKAGDTVTIAGFEENKDATVGSDVAGGGTGNGNDLNITARLIDIKDKAIVAASIINGKGENGTPAQAGNVNITATEKFSISNNSVVFSEVGSSSVGNGGTINISAPLISIDNSSVNTQIRTGGKGTAAGDINIFATELLEVKNGGQLASSTKGEGNAGSINISDSKQVIFDGVGNHSWDVNGLDDGTLSISGVFSYVGEDGLGAGGNITINTSTLEMKNKASLDAKSATGSAGKININANDAVFITDSSITSTSNNSANDSFSEIKIGGFQAATKITDLPKTVQINNSKLNTTNTGTKFAGDIIINAGDKVSISNKSEITSQGNLGRILIGKYPGYDDSFLPKEVNIEDSTLSTTNGKIIDITPAIDSGDISIDALNKIAIVSSKIEASTQRIGNAGKITIQTNINGSTTLDKNSNLQSRVDSKGNGTGGNVIINTGLLLVDNGSSFSTSTFGTGNAGSINITATDSVKFDASSVFSQVNSAANGTGGGVDIFAKSLELLNSSSFSTSTFGTGNAGSINITATDSVKFDASSVFSQVNSAANGMGGGVDISTQFLELINGSRLSVKTSGTDNAGNINLNTSILTVASGSNILASTSSTSSQADGGKITVNAANAVNLGLGVQDSEPVISVETSGAGKAGDIIINTPLLTVSDTARITATATKDATNTEGGGSITLNASKINLAGTVGIFAETQGQAPAGKLQFNSYNNQSNIDLTLFPGSTISASTTANGKGGDLQLTSPEAINISGKGKLAVETKSQGDAGTIQITTKNLNIQEAEISASTSGSGKGGNIQINANNFKAESGSKLTTTTSADGQAGTIILKIQNDLTLTGKGTGIFANTEIGSTGAGGSIDIDPITMLIESGASVKVNSQGTGIAGNIKIAADDLTLRNPDSSISAETVGGEGGNIDLNITKNILLRDNSLISAEAKNAGNGGNININAGGFILAFLNENSDIVANAFAGKGGTVTGKAVGIFGFRQFVKERTPESDFIASSKLGIDGIISIETNQDTLPELPRDFINIESLNKDVCAVKDDKIAGGSSFIITGKGGLPADTHELISNSPAFVEWENSSETVTQASNSPVRVTLKNTNHHQQIQQAQGWIIGENGKVILTADSQNVTLQTDKNNLPDCK